MKWIETEVEIAASPEQVWAVLTDFSKWSQWNRVMPAIEGEPVEGSRVELELALPGRRSSYQRPYLMRVAPNHELRWFDQVVIPRIFVSEHWFRLEAAPQGCVVRHGEQFAGLLSIFMGKKSLQQTERIFALINRDLKERVEELN